MKPKPQEMNTIKIEDLKEVDSRARFLKFHDRQPGVSSSFSSSHAASIHLSALSEC